MYIGEVVPGLHRVRKSANEGILGCGRMCTGEGYLIRGEVKGRGCHWAAFLGMASDLRFINSFT